MLSWETTLGTCSSLNWLIDEHSRREWEIEVGKRGEWGRNGEWSCEYNTQVPTAYRLSLPKTVYLLNYLPLLLLPLFSPYLSHISCLLFPIYLPPPHTNLLTACRVLNVSTGFWGHHFAPLVICIYDDAFTDPATHCGTPYSTLRYPTLPFFLGRLRGCITRNCVAISRVDQFHFFCNTL